MKADVLVDVIGETCPIPLVALRKAVMKSEKGTVIEVRGTHRASREEIPMAVDSLGLKLLKNEESDGVWHIYIER